MKDTLNKTLRFNDGVSNIAASQANPIKHGIFVRHLHSGMAEYVTAQGVHHIPLENLKRREVMDDEPVIKRIAAWLREKYDREHDTNWNAPDVFEAQAREVYALIPERFRKRESGKQDA